MIHLFAQAVIPGSIDMDRDRGGGAEVGQAVNRFRPGRSAADIADPERIAAMLPGLRMVRREQGFDHVSMVNAQRAPGAVTVYR